VTPDTPVSATYTVVRAPFPAIATPLLVSIGFVNLILYTPPFPADLVTERKLNPKNLERDGSLPTKLPQATGSLFPMLEFMHAETDWRAAYTTLDADRISDVKQADTECIAAK